MIKVLIEEDKEIFNFFKVSIIEKNGFSYNMLIDKVEVERFDGGVPLTIAILSLLSEIQKIKKDREKMKLKLENKNG